MSRRPEPESLSSISGSVWTHQSGRWRIGCERADEIVAFGDGLDLHVELVAYRNHARGSILPANVLLPPASPAGSGRTYLQALEGIGGVLYGAWEEAVATST